MIRIRRMIAAVAVAVLAMVWASAALADKPPAYQGKAGAIQGVVQNGAKPSLKTTKTSGQLPFTGLDLVFFAAGAVGLALAGFSLRRVARD